MNTQSRSDLKSTAPTRVSRNAPNPFGGKDFTALAATLSPAVPSARESLSATAPYRQSSAHGAVVRGERDLPAPFAGVSHSHEVTRGPSKIRVSAGLCLP
jgi:hypothetical protein